MKLYTKTGDAGQTSLYGGERRSKADPRITAYGEVDELQAVLGVAAAYLIELPDVQKTIERIQYDGFVLCSQLAKPTPPTEKDPQITKERISWLEQEIDRFDAEVPPLRSFIMQGGSLGGAHLHLARAVCRRAERSMVSLINQEEVADEVRIYLNRLSDLLFVLARVVNYRQKQPETAWKWHL